MVSPDTIIEYAMKCEGAKWKHRARGHVVNGVMRMDCIGLIRWVGKRANAFSVSAEDPMWENYASYGIYPEPVTMRRVLEHFCTPVDSPKKGDILWMGATKDMPQHFGITSGDPYQPDTVLIHSHFPSKRVECTRFNRDLIRAIHSVWRYPRVVHG